MVPPDNPSSSSSRKEKEVIEQQRKLAAALAKRVKPPPPPPTSAMKHPSKASNKAPLPKRDPPKRPTRAGIKRPNLSSSASNALAVARARATATRTPCSSSSSSSTYSKPRPKPKPKPAPVDVGTSKLKRKQPTGTEGATTLASLVQNVASCRTNGDDTLSSAAFATNISPEDFWRNIRDWDFVSEIPCGADTTLKPPRKAIPDTFISSRHYMAQWAPLVLAETRAQLLSEVMTDVGQLSKSASPLHRVDVETTWKSGGRNKCNRGLHTDLIDMDSCFIKLTTKDRTSNTKVHFYANDVFGLVSMEQKDAVVLLLKGKGGKGAMDFCQKCCLVGHTEVQRKEINGLILKVSKKKWAQIGRPLMYFFRIGGNVTALREFTALCGVESIPLKRFLLGHHVAGNTTGRPPLGQGGKDETAHPQTAMLLKKMGGVEALGRGFVDYAQKKFNSSQLMAISASSRGYGEGGITLIKGPPGTGKTTTLVAVLNSLHIRQYNKYYDEVRRIAAMQTGNRQGALEAARKAKPRLLVCAPSNAAIDNICLKVMDDGFVDGSGERYNPSMIRVGTGQSSSVGSISLESKVNQILSEMDLGQLESSIAGFRMELQRINTDIVKLRRRCHGIINASAWPLGKDWEIRIDEETFESTGRCFFVNHSEHRTTYECPPPPEPGETQFPARAMPEYKAFMQRIVKSVESYFSIKTNLERNVIVKGSLESGANNFSLRQSLESHVLNSVHMVMTTLGTAGNRVFEGADRFEVVVVDEAAQSVEPATLSALQLGSRHCVLVGDPQQLPATIFNVSGRSSKYDRSLFQRLEEAGEKVHMLNQQYRMHPKISHFPRHIFYDGNLLDGPNVIKPNYGQPLLGTIQARVPAFQPFTVLDLDSREERGGTSLSNSTEAELALYLYLNLRTVTSGLSTKSRVAIITPYSQQASLLRRIFRLSLGNEYERFVEINTVDAFQGREANIVIFSAVRAAGSHGIGFLSDVRRMNVALTRAKHFLFVIARADSIVVNPYWRDLVSHARDSDAVVRVPISSKEGKTFFGDMSAWGLEDNPNRDTSTHCQPRPVDPRKKRRRF